MKLFIIALLAAISYAQTEGRLSAPDVKIQAQTGYCEAYESLQNAKESLSHPYVNKQSEFFASAKYIMEEIRHSVTSFLWGTGTIFFLMYIVPFSLMCCLSWKGRGILIGLCILYLIADYNSQASIASSVQAKGWSEPLHSYLGFLLAKTPTFQFGITNSFWNDYVFSSTYYLITVPYFYFSALVRSLRFDWNTATFQFQEFNIVSDQHVVDYFFRTPAYRASSFDEETGLWHVGSRGYDTIGSYANVPGLNATITKEGNLTSINDRKGNIITPSCKSWDLAKQLFWDSVVMDLYIHWHLANHFQFSYVYGTQALISEEHPLRKILQVHNRYHATIDYSAVQSPFAQVTSINRPYNPEFGEFTTPTLGKSNETEWNYSPLGLTRGRDDTMGYVYGQPATAATLSRNVMHAASDHGESKTFPPAYARDDSPQMHTPLGPYLKDQYECFHEFVADLSSEDNWYEDADVLKFFEASASVDESVATQVNSKADRDHFIAMIMFENSFLHSLDHGQIHNSFRDTSSWSWHHHNKEELSLPECNDSTPVQNVLGTKSWFDWVKQATTIEAFTPWHTWANLVISDDDFMMRTEYGFQQSHQKRLRSRMRTCLMHNHKSEKHREIVQSLRQDLGEFSSSIEW